MALRLGNGRANVLKGTASLDQIFGYGGNDRLSGFAGNDFIAGGGGNDRIDAGSGDDIVNGGGGNDVIYGGLNFDILNAGDGNDRLFGGNNSDILLGGDGKDYLNGGADDDLLEGGLGADRFAFSSLSHSAPGSVDIILDFNRVEGDKLDLRGLHLDKTGADRDQISVGHSGGDTFVRVNTDADAAFEFIVKLEGNIRINIAQDILV